MTTTADGAGGSPAGRAPDPGAAARIELGRRGEDLAAEYLTAQGLVVLDRNWRSRGGELDLVLTDGDRLVVVCEVKTRSGTGFGLPAEAVTAAKAARIRRLTQAWLAARRVGWVELRFDVVAVVLPPAGTVGIEHYAGAF